MNPTPSPERPEHNPDNLTPEQYGAPEFRLLRVGEMTRETDEYWSTCFEDWRQTNEEPKTLNPDLDDTTYRRRVATRTAPEAPTPPVEADKDAEKISTAVGGGR